ncbi:MAG: glycosyltransferase family 1 protein [Erysipelotrichaceae bacterium]|nr:glycosyltransferase family 1 protein [Clostridia bacterium]MBQ6217604.1 glycosyltransferase family 1 protein [Erysipelotrichaceae bacterium]
MKKLIILSEQKSFKKRPLSHDAVLGQENEFFDYGNGNVEIKYKSIILKGINRITGKLKMNPVCDPFTFKKREDGVYLYIAMSINYLKSNLHLLKRLQKSGNKIALYVWDCWQPEYEKWEKVLDDLKPDYIFWSFKQNYLFFKNKYANSFWVPQSANRYYFKDLHMNKTRLFIQMGRVNKGLHEKILRYLEKRDVPDSNENYVYRRKEKEALFPDLNDLVREINRSRYIVCIPKIYESPEKTGDVCAMTGRYYEAIACKTMIIGKKPLIFDELFPKDGMIEFKEDLSDFDDKIDALENDNQKYQDIVEQNYRCFMEKHTWACRLKQILAIINEELEVL